jgi:uncharacterized membrane protein YiaA
MVSVKTIAWSEIILGLLVILVPFAAWDMLLEGTAVAGVLWTEFILGIIVLAIGAWALTIKEMGMHK